MQTNLLLCILCLACSFSSKAQVNSAIDSSSAKTIITQAWQLRFGNIIHEAKPFYTISEGDSVWTVSGTLHGVNGGFPFGRVRKTDGKILSIAWKPRL